MLLFNKALLEKEKKHRRLQRNPNKPISFRRFFVAVSFQKAVQILCRPVGTPHLDDIDD